jgi:RNA polymerase sigma-70 factor (ECF subfamily)
VRTQDADFLSNSVKQLAALPDCQGEVDIVSQRSSLVPETGRLASQSREDLISRYQRRVFAVIYRMTGRHSEVDDLCQETFLQIFRSLPGFREGTDLDAWVYRIAMNVSIDYHRRRSKEKGAMEILERSASKNDEEGPDQEKQAAVRKALDVLPAAQKSVVVLRLFEGLSHDEIASILEIPAATVRWRLHSALEKLESLLGRYLDV